MWVWHHGILTGFAGKPKWIRREFFGLVQTVGNPAATYSEDFPVKYLDSSPCGFREILPEYAEHFVLV